MGHHNPLRKTPQLRHLPELLLEAGRGSPQPVEGHLNSLTFQSSCLRSTAWSGTPLQSRPIGLGPEPKAQFEATSLLHHHILEFKHPAIVWRQVFKQASYVFLHSLLAVDLPQNLLSICTAVLQEGGEGFPAVLSWVGWGVHPIPVSKVEQAYPGSLWSRAQDIAPAPPSVAVGAARRTPSRHGAIGDECGSQAGFAGFRAWLKAPKARGFGLGLRGKCLGFN